MESALGPSLRGLDFGLRSGVANALCCRGEVQLWQGWRTSASNARIVSPGVIAELQKCARCWQSGDMRSDHRSYLGFAAILVALLSVVGAGCGIFAQRHEPPAPTPCVLRSRPRPRKLISSCVSMSGVSTSWRTRSRLPRRDIPWRSDRRSGRRRRERFQINEVIELPDFLVFDFNNPKSKRSRPRPARPEQSTRSSLDRLRICAWLAGRISRHREDVGARTGREPRLCADVQSRHRRGLQAHQARNGGGRRVARQGFLVPRSIRRRAYGCTMTGVPTLTLS